MKKNFLFILLSSILISCSNKLPYVQSSGSIDYKVYSDVGFFITESNSVSFEYSPIGSISGTSSEGWEVLNIESKRENKKDDDIYKVDDRSKRSQKIKYGKFISASREDALDVLVEEAINLGADAIINLEFTYIQGVTSEFGRVISPQKYIASGMAIKRR